MDTPRHTEAADLFLSLQQLTPARIFLGSVDGAMPLTEYFRLKLAHAKARDAVFKNWDATALMNAMQLVHPTMQLSSRATSRAEYILNPQLGRHLTAESIQLLKNYDSSTEFDLCFVVTEGLSAPAINHHAEALLHALLPAFFARHYSIAPLCFVSRGRVAIGDAVAVNMRAKLSVVLIGERPGLSSYDSLGVYLTYNPGTETTDAMRNCVSNIRPGGLSIDKATGIIYFLVREALKLKQTGIALKDHHTQYEMVGSSSTL